MIDKHNVPVILMWYTSQMKAQFKGFVLQKVAKSILEGECPDSMTLPILTLLV